MEAQSSPLHLNLKEIEEQVRHLLHKARPGYAVAVARWYSLDSKARARQLRKADIHYVIAREHGFKSWQSLKDRLSKDDSPSYARPTPAKINSQTRSCRCVQ